MHFTRHDETVSPFHNLCSYIWFDNLTISDHLETSRPVWIWRAKCSWCDLTDLRKWLHFHQAQVRACLQIVTHFVVQSDLIMTWPWRSKMPTQYQMVDGFEIYWKVVCSRISFWSLSFCFAHLSRQKMLYCGFWSTRTLLYFPLSVRLSVRSSQAWHLNFSQ